MYSVTESSSQKQTKQNVRFLLLLSFPRMLQNHFQAFKEFPYSLFSGVRVVVSSTNKPSISHSSIVCDLKSFTFHESGLLITTFATLAQGKGQIAKGRYMESGTVVSVSLTFFIDQWMLWNPNKHLKCQKSPKFLQFKYFKFRKWF